MYLWYNMTYTVLVPGKTHRNKPIATAGTDPGVFSKLEVKEASKAVLITNTKLNTQCQDCSTALGSAF